MLCLSPVKPKTPTLTTTGSTTAVSGTDKVLTCDTASTGVTITYQFYKASSLVTTGVSGATLTLSSPTVTGDSGSYTCDATATATSAVSAASTALDIEFVGKSGRTRSTLAQPTRLTRPRAHS